MDQFRRPKFTRHRPKSHRRHFVDAEDVRTVLRRLPPELWDRLRAVHFNDRARGRRTLGYVNMGHREIALCALPHRVSLAGALQRDQSPAEFGAVRACQWPVLAIRRFMLYDVLLHELGHLQIVRPSAADPRRRFAREDGAERFAAHWRRALWAEPFDHPDPAHHPPTAEELAEVRERWTDAHREYKRASRERRMPGRNDSAAAAAAASCFARALVMCPRHSMALQALGELSWAGIGTEQSPARGVRLLSDALHADPGLYNARLHLAIALDYVGRRDEARAAFERAVRVDAYPPVTAVQYARVVAGWGLVDEADTRFERILRRRPKDHYAMTEFARALLIDGRPEAATSAARAMQLCECAISLEPAEVGPAAHYFLALALHRTGGDGQRAVAHLRTAIGLRPDDPAAEARLNNIQTATFAQGASR
jgi:tetratricopeptide (TPR) repeat protein